MSPSVQCKSMGIQGKWEEVLDAYRDVNKLFGDIIKVTNLFLPISPIVLDLLQIGLDWIVFYILVVD